MKRAWLFVIGNICLGGLLVYGTVGSIAVVAGITKSEPFAWLSIAGVGLVISVSMLLWATFFITLDFLWAFLLLMWIIRSVLHIREDDHAVRLS